LYDVGSKRTALAQAAYLLKPKALQKLLELSRNRLRDARARDTMGRSVLEVAKIARSIDPSVGDRVIDLLEEYGAR